MTYVIHYLVADRARCGQPRRRSWTTDPARVTCKACLALMKGTVQ